MTFRWSWFFTLYWLLVRPSFAHRDSQNAEATVPRNAELGQIIARPPLDGTKNNSVVVAAGVAIGLIVLVTLALAFVYMRRRRTAALDEDIEERAVKAAEEEPQWWLVDLQSAKRSSWWELGTKGRGDIEKGSVENASIKSNATPLDHFRALASKVITQTKHTISAPSGATKHPELLPDPSPTDYIVRPLPAVPNHKPRYPSILERPGNPAGFSPTPPKNLNLARAIFAAESREKLNRRRLQVPSKALLAPHGRLLPGTGERILKPPNSPSHRRRSWLSKQALKNPFLPLKESDVVLPPTVSAGLAMRQHRLQPQLIRNPPNTIPPDPPLVPLFVMKTKRVPVPKYEENRVLSSPSQPPQTGGFPRPKLSYDERALRSAMPLGRFSKPVVYPRQI